MRFDLNTCTAALVTDPVTAVPSRDAFTFVMTSASALKDASTSRIDFICEAESPDAGVAGIAGVAGTAGVVVEAGVAGIAGVAGVAEPPPPVEPPPPLLVEEQRVAEGVIVTVTLALGAYLMSDWLLLQMKFVCPVDVSALICSRPGAVTWKLEPDASDILKFVSFTVMDAIEAFEPETFSVMPFTLKTTSVVKDTSSKAANVREGAMNNAARIPARASIRGIVSLFN